MRQGWQREIWLLIGIAVGCTVAAGARATYDGLWGAERLRVRFLNDTSETLIDVKVEVGGAVSARSRLSAGDWVDLVHDHHLNRGGHAVISYRSRSSFHRSVVPTYLARVQGGALYVALRSDDNLYLSAIVDGPEAVDNVAFAPTPRQR